MANYSDEEIQTVVDSLVRSSIRRPYDTLGVRRTDITFSDVQESVAGVFLMYPRSPLYMLYLAGVQVREVYESVIAAAQELKSALAVLRKRSFPVRDVSSLVNAKVALFELESVVNSRAPKDLTTLPAYKRFDSNLDRFLKASGGNIKSEGAIIRTPEQARNELPSLVSALEEVTYEYLRRVAVLSVGLDDYNGLGLAQLLAKTVIANARVRLDARVAELEGMSETARLEVLRETVLDVLGIKAVVRTFGNFAGLSSGSTVNGNLEAFADVARPGIPATSKVTLNGGLALVPGVTEVTSTNWMKIWVDTPVVPTPSLQLFFVESTYPKIEGVASGPYVVTAGVTDSIRFLVDGVTVVTIALTAGTRTAAQVAADLDLGLNAAGFSAGTYFYPLLYKGEVVSTALNVISLAFGEFPTSSIQIGYEVDFYYGVNAVTTRTITAVTPGVSGVASFVVDGAALTASSTNRIEVGTVRNVRVFPDALVTSVMNRRKIQVKPSTDIQKQTGLLLGMYGEIYGFGQPSTAKSLAEQVTTGTATCTGAVEQTAIYTGVITTDPSDATKLVTGAAGSEALDMSVVISEGVNAGRYFIEELTATPGTFKIRGVMPLFQDGFGQGVSMTGTIGYDSYTVSSRTTDLTSTIAYEGPSNSGSMTVRSIQKGTTYYAKFSSGFSDVVEGDRLEVYLTSTTVPDLTLNILEVYSDGVFRMDYAIPMDLSISMTATTLPFLRLVVGRVADFEALSEALITQLKNPNADPEAYFKDLNRFINPLRVNLNPSNSDIGSAESRVDDLTTTLEVMDTAIAAFEPSHVPQMDSTVKMLKEKGVDRGLDLLLSGEFSVFFGLTQEETSYAGAFQKAVRDVARMDLAIHKTNRITSSQLISSAESENYEYSTSDLDQSPRVDPPVDIDQSAT